MILIGIYLIAGISQIIILYKKNYVKEMAVTVVLTILLITVSTGIYFEYIPRNLGIMIYRKLSQML